MTGFIKMPVIEFDTFNNLSTVKYIDQTGDLSCEQYTYCIPDADPLYCWARIEHDFITELPILNYDDVVAQGMIVDKLTE